MSLRDSHYCYTVSEAGKKCLQEGQSSLFEFIVNKSKSQYSFSLKKTLLRIQKSCKKKVDHNPEVLITITDAFF